MNAVKLKTGETVNVSQRPPAWTPENREELLEYFHKSHASELTKKRFELMDAYPKDAELIRTQFQEIEHMPPISLESLLAVASLEADLYNKRRRNMKDVNEGFAIELLKLPELPEK